jgi:RNA-directed DNA polymerase
MSGIYINIQTQLWTQIPWTKVEAYVHRLQTRIYQASRDQHYGKMRALQKRLTSGVHAKLLAVRLVTVQQTNGLLQPGPPVEATQRALVGNRINEGQAPTTGTSRQRPHQYTESLPKAAPPLGNLPDLAKQALAKMALEPEWEARFEPYLYGYRPGSTGPVQALSALRSALGDQTPKYVLYADIKFEGLDPGALLNKLNTYPSLRKQIKAWLQADPLCLFVGKRRRSPITVRTVSLAPLLANIAVHGVAHVLLYGLRNAVSTPAAAAARAPQLHHCNAVGQVFSSGLRLYGYADEWVVLHEKASVVFKAKQLLATWLNTMGLTLHPDSTRITTAVAGFDYGGHRISTRKSSSGRQPGSTSPSKLELARLLDTIRGILRSTQGAAAHVLIRRLLPHMMGWGNDFKYSDSFRVFKRMDHTIFQQLRAWVVRRHAHWGRHRIKRTYFPANQTWVVNGLRYRDNWLLHAAYYNGKRLRRVHLVRLRWEALRRRPASLGRGRG